MTLDPTESQASQVGWNFAVPTTAGQVQVPRWTGPDVESGSSRGTSVEASADVDEQSRSDVPVARYSRPIAAESIQLAACVNRRQGGMAGTLTLIAVWLLFGVGVFALGFLSEPPENKTREQHVHDISYVGGGGIIALGLLGLGIYACSLRSSRHYALVAFEDRLEIVTKKKATAVPWSEIRCVTHTTFSGGMGHPPRDICELKYGRGSKVRYESIFEGDPGGVLEAVLTHCNYIIFNPEGYGRA